jgi:hypothetical protein
MWPSHFCAKATVFSLFMAAPFAALCILNMAEPFLRESYCIVIIYGRAICSFAHSKYGRAILARKLLYCHRLWPRHLQLYAF